MKKYIYLPVLTCCMLLAFMSCAEDEIPLFDATSSNIYFEWAKEGRENESETLDSLDVSFAFELPTVTDSLINVPVKIQGYTADFDRIINLKVLADESTAIEGVHYQMPNSVVLPADSVRAYIPVSLFRDASLKDGPVSLKFQLSENQYFNTDIYTTEEYYNVDRELSFTEFEFTFSDILTKPAYWSAFFDYYPGTWSAKKIYLLAELTGTDVEVFATMPSLPQIFAFTRTLRDYLAAQKAAGTPVYEEDGVTEMTVGIYASYI
ncbi:DUF4843 domain-containing protein [Aestuariibaculum sp. YM273]|uniref:DUF4843 domain-containing protein n=1 Tax=Aestuariibaculum sp. YM273 TaxID=3070659 RepID=UPI0027DE867A|nr:DUF4843 domain-containing protein [Aestuariibaculum sp. YM273]WMI64170.1 DUF4843 domain-containing protein [Aestuariibaculum sp. YM273]